MSSRFDPHGAQPLPINTLIPAAPQAISWTRFTVQFEPYEFTGWIDESQSWKKTAYVGDWSPLSNKFLVKGPDAIRFFQDISVNSFEKFEIGQAKHSIQCGHNGKIMVEGVLLRLAEDEVLFTSGPSYWTEYQFGLGTYDAVATQLGLGNFIIQLQGPASLHILEKATGVSQRDYGFMRFQETSIGGMPFYSLRQGMSGELGFELHGKAEHAVAIHQALLDAGEEFGVRRLGGRTKMVNHVEACFPTPSVDFLLASLTDEGYVSFLEANHPELLIANRIRVTGSKEFSDLSEFYRDPTELGWIKNIKFDHDFIGRQVLEPVVKDPKRKMATLIWNKDDVMDVHNSLFRDEEPFEFMEMPRSLLGTLAVDKVLAGDREVGVSTSRCYSYHFREMISLCSLDIDHAEPGTKLTLIWGSPDKRQKEIRVVVAPAPYKRDGRKVDVSTLPSYI